jgi:hypothetical protein
MSRFLHLRSSKFPILPGEESELVNEGLYGKALALYLQEQLHARGYEVSGICCEDWGWWVSVAGAPFTLGVCIYRQPDESSSSDASPPAADNKPTDFVCTTSLLKPRVWSWSKFRFLDTTSWDERLTNDLRAIFQADPEIEFLGDTDDMPF